MPASHVHVYLYRTLVGTSCFVCWCRSTCPCVYPRAPRCPLLVRRLAPTDSCPLAATAPALPLPSPRPRRRRGVGVRQDVHGGAHLPGEEAGQLVAEQPDGLGRGRAGVPTRAHKYLGVCRLRGEWVLALALALASPPSWITCMGGGGMHRGLFIFR